MVHILCLVFIFNNHEGLSSYIESTNANVPPSLFSLFEHYIMSILSFILTYGLHFVSDC